MRRSDNRVLHQICGDGGTDIKPRFIALTNAVSKQLLAALGCPEHLYKKSPLRRFGKTTALHCLMKPRAKRNV